MLYLLIGIEHYKLQSGFIDTLFTYIYIYFCGGGNGNYATSSSSHGHFVSKGISA